MDSRPEKDLCGPSVIFDGIVAPDAETPTFIGQTLIPRRSAIVWRLMRWRTLLQQVRCCRRAALAPKWSNIVLSH